MAKPLTKSQIVATLAEKHGLIPFVVDMEDYS